MSDDTKKKDEDTANAVSDGGPAGDPTIPPLPLPDLVEVEPEEDDD